MSNIGQKLPKKVQKINWWVVGAVPVILILLVVVIFSFFSMTDSAKFWAKQGKQLFAATEYQKAVEAYQKAVNKDPENPAYLSALGSCYTKLGDLDRAFKQFTAALTAKPDFPDAILGEADAYYTMGSTEKAQELYQRATQLVTGNAEIYCKLGLIAHVKGDYDTAIAMYRKALEIDPANHNAAQGVTNAEQARTQQETVNRNPAAPAIPEQEVIDTGMNDEPPPEPPSYESAPEPSSDEPSSSGE